MVYRHQIALKLVVTCGACTWLITVMDVHKTRMPFSALRARGIIKQENILLRFPGALALLWKELLYCIKLAPFKMPPVMDCVLMHF